MVTFTHVYIIFVLKRNGVTHEKEQLLHKCNILKLYTRKALKLLKYYQNGTFVKLRTKSVHILVYY